MSDIIITPNKGSANAPTIQFSGSANASASIRLEVLPEGQVAFLGKSGSLFSISDNMVGSLMAVSDISGLPILEVFSDDRIIMGKYNKNTLYVSGTNVGVRKVPLNAVLDVSGSVAVTGSLGVAGSILADGGVTASLLGTASYALNALTASYSYSGTSGTSGTSGAGTISGGTANYVARFTGATTLSTGVIYDDATNVGIGTTTPSAKLQAQSNYATSANDSDDADATILIENIHASGDAVLRMRGATGVSSVVYGKNGGTDRLNFIPRNDNEQRIAFNQNGVVSISNTTAGSSNAGALVVQGGISVGNTGSATSYFGGAVTATGTLRATNGNLYTYGESGNATDGILFFNSAANNYIYGSSSQLAIYTAGVQRATISSTGATFAGAVTATNTGAHVFGTTNTVRLEGGNVITLTADAGTTNVVDGVIMSHTTSGTAAAGFGVKQSTSLEDAAGTERTASEISTAWVDATAYTSAVTLRTRNGVSGLLDALVLGPTGTATFAGAVTAGGNLTLPAASAGYRLIVTGTNNTGTGQLVIQAGGGSAEWGGTLNLFETAHATKGGYVGVGLGVSGAKFTVNSSGFSDSGEVASIDRSGNATFAGAVTATGSTTSGLSLFAGGSSAGAGATSVEVGINRSSTATGGALKFYTSGSQNWYVGLGATGTNTDIEFYNYSGSLVALKLANTTGAATFAGDVTAGGDLFVTGNNAFLGSTTVGGAATPKIVVLASNGDYGIGFQGAINGAIRSGVKFTTASNLGGLDFMVGGDNNTDASVTALTLAATGAATFAGAVTSTQFQSDVYRQQSGDRSLLSFSGVETVLGGGTPGDTTKINANGVQALRIDASLLATFAGAVKAGAAAFDRLGLNSNPINTVSTAQSFARFQSTGADFYTGTESSISGSFFPSSTAYAAVLYNSAATPMHFYTSGTLRATISAAGDATFAGAVTTGGKLLVNTSVDSSALLQVGTNTTNLAGGMIFGTDTKLYRGGNSNLKLDGTNPSFDIVSGGTVYGRIETDAVSLYISSVPAASLILRTNQTTALTLSSAQAATFAGAVTVSGNTVNIGGSDSSPVVNFKAADTGNVTLNFGGTTNPDKGRIVYSDNSDLFDFYTADTARMRIGTTGTVTINSTTAGSSNAGALVIAGGLATGAASYLGGNTTVNGEFRASNIRLENGTFIAFGSADGEGMTGNQSANSLTLRTNSTTALTINSAQAATFAGAVSVGTGAAVGGATAGAGGLAFPATAVAVADANTLDDYEEGTFTPIVSDASSGGNLATLSDAEGVYTKIGNIVYWRFNVVLTSKASASAGNTVFIQGLPFQSATIPNNWYNPNPTIIRNITFAGYVQFNVSGGNSYGFFRENVSNAAGDDIIFSDLTNSAAMQASGFYKVA